LIIIIAMDSSRKYYTLLAISAILLMGTLANATNAYAAKPDRIDFRYNGPGGMLVATDDGTPDPYTTTPNGDQLGVMVSDSDVIQVTPGTSPETKNFPDLGTNSRFSINGIPLVVLDTGDDQEVGNEKLHTSCSKQLLPEITMVGASGHKLTVVEVFGAGDDPDCPPPDIVGGTGFSIDKSALLVSGTQTTAAWMIPVIISAIGFAIVIARKL
jgi:hypothetical protein